MKNENQKIPFEIIERFAKKNGIKLTDSVKIHESLLDYLDKASESKESISPDQLQDEAWHSFMLHSKDYLIFCKTRYGHFIHHIPTGMNRDPFAIKVQKLLEMKKNHLAFESHGGDSGIIISTCDKLVCGSDRNAPSSQRTILQKAECIDHTANCYNSCSNNSCGVSSQVINCYNSCSNDSCGVSNCNSDGDAR